MLPRERLKALTDRLQQDHDTGGSEELRAEIERGRQLFNRVGWSQNESSMVNAEALPFVNDMVRRLKEKYANELQAKSTDDIINDLQNVITDKIKLATAANDNNKAFTLQKALRLLTANDSILRRQEEPPVIHGHNLREILALMWLAASDMNMVFPPIHERQLMKLNEAGRAAAKMKKVNEESIENIFLLTLTEIRRAHNADTPERQRDLVKDYPSCGGGTFGRLVMNSAVMNCVAALTTETGLEPKNLEETSQRLASMKTEEIDFSRLTLLCEDYVCEVLNESSADTKESVYRTFNEFINGDVEFMDENSENYAATLAKLNEHKRLYKLFTDSFVSEHSFENFLSFVDNNNPKLFEAIRAGGSFDQLREIYSEYAKSLAP